MDLEAPKSSFSVHTVSGSFRLSYNFMGPPRSSFSIKTATCSSQLLVRTCSVESFFLIPVLQDPFFRSKLQQILLQLLGQFHDPIQTFQC
ncbi:hypothetical protein HanPI659440_Chr11g0441601 [Helianthus annuus]|nr:hypothetical protein HanPI659440_Chr11g0441601 [Helianthus annuus]